MNIHISLNFSMHVNSFTTTIDGKHDHCHPMNLLDKSPNSIITHIKRQVVEAQNAGQDVVITIDNHIESLDTLAYLMTILLDTDTPSVMELDIGGAYIANNKNGYNYTIPLIVREHPTLCIEKQ